MLSPNFTPYPVIETERLVLRQITAGDANEMFLLRSNKEIMKYIERPLAVTVNDAVELINNVEKMRLNNEGINWGITIKGTNKIIGTIGIWRIQKENYRAEIGYLLHTDHHRKGFMKEAIAAAIHFGFTTLQLHSLEAHINPANEASRKLLESTGFIQEAYFKQSFYYNGKFLDTVIFSLLNKPA